MGQNTVMDQFVLDFLYEDTSQDYATLAIDWYTYFFNVSYVYIFILFFVFLQITWHKLSSISEWTD